MTEARPLKALPVKVALGLLTGSLIFTGAAGASAAASPAHSQSAAPAITAQQRQFPVLRQGSNPNWPRVTVRSLQYLLRARGASIAVDGVFGSGTRAAVVAFQRSHGLTADGVAGAGTWRALIITVRQGSTGNAVRAVQDQINFRNLRGGRTLSVDGIFGPSTRRAVVAFQQGIGLPADGTVGPATWPPLVNESNSG
jgi:murein L,D-transpeptidase YcbB/YkuD